MRLWSLHPGYLDPKGLVALWREALLAQAVIAGQTRGYRHHPQLKRFLESENPGGQIAAYLRAVCEEAVRRGYRFDNKKIGEAGAAGMMLVTQGQIDHEWRHLTAKLEARAPSWRIQFAGIARPQPHPLFRMVEGGIAEWEVVQGGSAPSAPRRRS